MLMGGFYYDASKNVIRYFYFVKFLNLKNIRENSNAK